MPKSWKVLKLQTIAEIQTGIAKGKKDVENPIELPYLRVANVQDGYLDLSEVKTITVSRHQYERYILREGDVLLTEGGDYDKLGRGTIWRGQIQSCIHQNHVFVVRPNRLLLLPEFFSYQVASSYGKKYFLSCAKQTTSLASINSTQLKNFPVLVPPIPEQKKIAEILTTWDEAIGLAERTIEAKKNRIDALMQRLIPSSLNSSYRVLEFKDIVEKCVDYRGRTPLKLGMSWGEGDIKALSANNVEMGYINFSKECYLGSETLYKRWMTNGDCEHGDILLTTEAPLGNIAQIPDNQKYILSQRVVLIRPKSNVVRKDYLFYFMMSKAFQLDLKRNSSGSTAVGIQRKRLDRIQISIPDLERQEKIANVLSTASAEISIQEQQLELLKQQKRSLMQKLLTGKWRVSTQKAA